MFPILRKYLLFFLTIFLCLKIEAQNTRREANQSTWKALIALGINSPSDNGFIDAASAKSVNFPTINLGVQYMIKRNYGVKLDLGYNRFSSEDNSPEFKINYTRINPQFVYDPSNLIGFLPMRLRTVAHAGPGITFTKALGNLGDQNQTFFNFNLGLELHYGINKNLSVYTDVSYIYGFTKLDDYNPALNGLGAFNGNLFNVTIGVAISLTDCYYCAE